MCKIFGLTSTAQMQMPALHALISRTHKALTATQRDGYGYSIGSSDGNHYTEKWNNPSAFPGPGAWPAIKANLAGLPVDADVWTSGTFPTSPGGALIAHARTSTCSMGSENAHPHYSHGWSMVHNGVVQPTKGRTKPCDSIHILDSLVTHKGAGKLHTDVAGYLAILAIDPKGRLVALRDERAPLVVAWVPSLSAWAFSSTDALLSEIVAAHHDKPFPLQPYHAVTNDGNNWKHEVVTAWEASKTVTAKAAKAFGDQSLLGGIPDYAGSKYASKGKKWNF